MFLNLNNTSCACVFLTDFGGPKIWGNLRVNVEIPFFGGFGIHIWMFPKIGAFPPKSSICS